MFGKILMESNGRRTLIGVWSAMPSKRYSGRASENFFGVTGRLCTSQAEADAGGAIRCKHCQHPVTGSVLGHLAYSCNNLSVVRLQGIEDSQHLVEQAVVELPLLPSKWLRGLLPLETPDPLNMKFNFVSSSLVLMLRACF